MIGEEIVHVKGYPKKLVIFLHGYIDTAESIDTRLTPLLDGLDNVAVHIPQAPLTCEIYETKRQWYSMHRFDPEDERKTVKTMKECVAIYNRMSMGLVETFNYLEPYIEQCLNEYGLGYKDLVLCGFSQGAMVALFTALRLKRQIAGVASFSGILAASDYIMKHARSHPDVLLIHGDTDNLVRFQSLRFTRSHLKKLGCHLDEYIIPDNNGRHMVTPDGLVRCVEFIKSRWNDELIIKTA